MDRDTARRHYSNLHRAVDGSELCRQRLADDTAASVRDIGGGIKIHDLVGYAAHDIDYYAWEATRIVNTGRQAIKDGIPNADRVQAALDRLEAVAPGLRKFRNAVTHPEDNKGADDITYFGTAVRLLPNGRVEYVIDPRHEHHDALTVLADAIRAALLPLVDLDEPQAP